MAEVTLTTDYAERFTNGETRLSVAASSVRDLCRLLEQRYPGLGEEIEQRSMLSIDGEMVQQGFLQPLTEDAAVFVFPRMEAG